MHGLFLRKTLFKRSIHRLSEFDLLTTPLPVEESLLVWIGHAQEMRQREAPLDTGSQFRNVYFPVIFCHRALARDLIPENEHSGLPNLSLPFRAPNGLRCCPRQSFWASSRVAEIHAETKDLYRPESHLLMKLWTMRQREPALERTSRFQSSSCASRANSDFVPQEGKPILQPRSTTATRGAEHPSPFV